LLFYDVDVLPSFGVDVHDEMSRKYHFFCLRSVDTLYHQKYRRMLLNSVHQLDFCHLVV